MIRNDSEYRRTIARITEYHLALVDRREQLRQSGLSDEQADQMMCDPTLRCQTLEDRIALYERRVVRTWKIVGVGTDGGRVVLDRFVTRERAHELRQMLLSCEVFREVLVERDQDRPIGVFEMAHTSGQDAGLLPGTNDHHHS